MYAGGAKASPVSLQKARSKPAVAPSLQQIDQRVEQGCHDTQKTDRHQKPIHLKDLTGVDDEITEPVFGSQEFTDDNTYKAQPDVYLHIADDRRDRAGNNDFGQCLKFVSLQGVNKLYFTRIHCCKAGVQI